MKKIIMAVGGLILSLAMLIAVYAAANYKSCYAHEDTIARFLVKEMPIGSSFEEVENWLEKRKGLETEVFEVGMVLGDRLGERGAKTGNMSAKKPSKLA